MAKKSKQSISWGTVFALVLLVLVLPLLVRRISQQPQLGDLRSRAIDTVHCPGTCKGEQPGSYIAGFVCVNSANQCATCQTSGQFSTQPLSSCTNANTTGTVGPAGSCNTSDKTYLYEECCAEGKSRLVTRTCQNNQFSWNVGSCTQANGGCTQGKQTGIVCPPKTAYYRGTCYPIGECAPQCAGKTCGQPDGCSGVCVDACSSQTDADRAVASVQTYGMKYAYSARPHIGGYYTNICGDTLTATKSCNNGCNPATGVCTSSTGAFVVKWTCNGKAIECRENESSWARSQSLGNVACGKTVAITLFSKNCRDGGPATWSCPNLTQLLDYMVWYTGDCNKVTPTPLRAIPTVTPYPTSTPRPSSTPRPTPTQIPTPTRRPTPTPTRRPTPTRAPTPRPTSTPRPTAGASGGIGGFGIFGGNQQSSVGTGVCNSTCTSSSGCANPNFCINGACRNPSCSGVPTCVCADGANLLPGVVSPTDRPILLAVTPQELVGCGQRCTYPLDCRGGFTCDSGLCRKPSCPQDADCLCDEKTPASALPLASPSASSQGKAGGGGGVWVIIGLGVLFIGLGVLAVRHFYSRLHGI